MTGGIAIKMEKYFHRRFQFIPVLVGVVIALAFSLSSYVAAGPTRSLQVSGRWINGIAMVVWDEYGYDELAGYRVYRIYEDQKSALQEDWMPIDFTRSGGASYQLADPSIKGAGKATYQIKGLVWDGSVLDLGVWDVAFPDPEDDAVFLPLPAPEELRVEIASDIHPESGPAVKVPVEEHDIYRVYFSTIADGLDLSESEVANLAANAELAMHTAGESVAYWVEDDNLLFYGWPVTNRYTIRNYFWIEPGSGMHMDSRLTEDISISNDQTHVGSATFRNRAFLNVDAFVELPDDFYFWSGYTVGSSFDYSAPLPGYATNDVSFEVHLRGFNENQNHAAHIFLNQEPVGQVTFSQREKVALEVTGAGGAENTLQIESTGALGSLFILQAFRAEYERYYTPIDGLLLAGDGGHGRLSAGRFTDAIVLDITDPFHPVRILGPSGVISPDHSWPADADTAWAFREVSHLPVVPSVVPGGFGSWMQDATNRIDYLVIAPRVFAEPAEELAAHRASLGLRVRVAYFEDICDEFAGGLRTPEAIREMLLYAHDNWEEPPWMVVLGGRGHTDYLDLRNVEANHLPPLLGFDSRNLRAADLLFADLTGDEIPDLSIGRISVQTEAQFFDYIHKLKAYENLGDSHSEALLDALFVADDADAGGDFEASNAILADIAQARYSVEAVGLDSHTLAHVRNRTRSGLTDGVGMIHYTGHGAPRNLAEENILHVDDVMGMAMHPPVPLLISLTCLIARFDIVSTGWQSLSEALIRKPSGGALTVYAPSGLSYNIFAMEMGQQFYQLHALDGVDTVGPLLARARYELGPKTGLAADAYRTYNLLGCPAVKLVGGPGGNPPSWMTNLAQWRWERFSYEELADPAFSYDAIEQFVSEHGILSIDPTERLQTPDAVDDLQIDVTSLVYWTAETAAPWITITDGAVGMDSGPVTYSIAVNEGPAREGEITISGGGQTRTVTVQQDAAIYTMTFDSAGGTLVDPIVQGAGTSVLAPVAPMRRGYDFAGWSPALSETMPSFNQTHVAQWERVIFPDGNVVAERRETFWWPAVADATWHEIRINRNGSTYESVWIEGQNTWIPPVNGLPGGDYQWWVRGWGPEVGLTSWSSARTFRVMHQAPGALALLGPMDAQDRNDLTFRWQKDADATWYHLWVSHPSGGTWHDSWYSMDGTGEGSAEVQQHPGGQSSWWMRGWGPDGMGPWSGPMTFSTPDPSPAKPSLVEPAGQVDSPVTFVYESARAEWFRVFVSSNGRPVIDQWTTSATLDEQNLDTGHYQWWVGAWNESTGQVVWSDAGVFWIP